MNNYVDSYSDHGGDPIYSHNYDDDDDENRGK